ncbi:MAG: hypothetical protein J7K00_04895 [Candidatus Diapherotrites archaeon]|nr:hypothetical protein [Candidatus Diapherotrites archaeon]
MILKQVFSIFLCGILLLSLPPITLAANGNPVYSAGSGESTSYSPTSLESTCKTTRLLPEEVLKLWDNTIGEKSTSIIPMDESAESINGIPQSNINPNASIVGDNGETVTEVPNELIPTKHYANLLENGMITGEQISVSYSTKKTVRIGRAHENTTLGKTGGKNKPSGAYVVTPTESRDFEVREEGNPDDIALFSDFQKRFNQMVTTGIVLSFVGPGLFEKAYLKYFGPKKPAGKLFGKNVQAQKLEKTMPVSHKEFMKISDDLDKELDELSNTINQCIGCKNFLRAAVNKEGIEPEMIQGLLKGTEGNPGFRAQVLGFLEDWSSYATKKNQLMLHEWQTAQRYEDLIKGKLMGNGALENAPLGLITPGSKFYGYADEVVEVVSGNNTYNALHITDPEKIGDLFAVTDLTRPRPQWFRDIMVEHYNEIEIDATSRLKGMLSKNGFKIHLKDGRIIDASPQKMNEISDLTQISHIEVKGGAWDIPNDWYENEGEELWRRFNGYIDSRNFEKEIGMEVGYSKGIKSTEKGLIARDNTYIIDKKGRQNIIEKGQVIPEGSHIVQEGTFVTPGIGKEIREKKLQWGMRQQYANSVDNIQEVLDSILGPGWKPKYINPEETAKYNFERWMLSLDMTKAWGDGSTVARQSIERFMTVNAVGFVRGTLLINLFSKLHLGSFTIYPGPINAPGLDSGEKLYDEAYLDIFANYKLDDGDFFNKYWLNNFVMPLPVIKDLFADENRAGQVDNMAYIDSTIEGIISGGNPKVKLGSLAKADSNKSLETFDIIKDFNNVPSETFATEFPKPKNRKIGRTLLSKTNEVNIESTIGGNDSEGIDLSYSMGENELCDQKLLSKDIATIPYLNREMSLTDPMTAGLELFPGLGDIMVWGVETKFSECIDDSYYLMLYTSLKEDSKSQDAVRELQDAASQATAFFDSAGVAENGASLDSTAQEIQNKISNMSKAQNMLQANAKFKHGFTGSNSSDGLFYFWCKECEITKNSENGRECYENSEGIMVCIDAAEGNITGSEGNPIIGWGSPTADQHPFWGEDFARIQRKDMGIPATMIPQSMTYLTLPAANETMFIIDNKGYSWIHSEEASNCFGKAVADQTGQPLQSNSLFEVLGFVIAVETTDGVGSVSDNSIFFSGSDLRVIGEDKSEMTISTDRKTGLSGNLKGAEERTSMGEMTNIYFQNGLVTWKKGTDKLIIWIYSLGSANKQSVQNMEVTPTKITNEINGCVAEWAFDLQIMGAANPLAQKDVAGLQQGLDTIGPVQIFETDDEIFQFTSKLEDICRYYLKIYNKKTREWTQFEIEDVVTVPGGFKIIGVEDEEHTLLFRVEDGRPILTHNGQDQFIKSASAKNGTFYYDPSSGTWYASNSQLIPLSDLFKQNGFKVSSDNGQTSAVPGQNPIGSLVINNPGAPIAPLNLPLFPQEPAMLALMLLAMLSSMLAIRLKRTEGNK